MMTATATTQGNRRNHPRVPLATSIQVVHRGRVSHISSQDISEGGIRLADAALSVNSRVKLFVPVPHCELGQLRRARMLMFKGEVVWRRDGDVGVRFVEPPLEHLLEVRDFVSHAAQAA